MIGGLLALTATLFRSYCYRRTRKLRGLNVIGLKRSGFEEATVKSIPVLLCLFQRQNGTFVERLAEAHENIRTTPMIMEMIAFIDEALRRSPQTS